MPVSYDGNQVLECQVTFAYDRYYFGNIESLNRNEESASFPQIKPPTNPMNSLDKPSKGSTGEVNDKPTSDLKVGEKNDETVKAAAEERAVKDESIEEQKAIKESFDMQ
tara:strand:+ start:135 stop:461 length:327 start_codon:yes stop_codon:yes gene_type:complete